MEIVRIALTNNLFGLTGGANGIYGIARPSLFGMVFSSPKRQFYLIWTFTILTMFLFYVLEHSRVGRALNYIRYDDLAASGCGIDVTRYKLMAFTVSAALAGAAGTLFAMNYSTLVANKFDFNTSILILVFVVLGGLGNMLGSIIAATALTILPEALRQFSDYRMLVYAIVLILVMLATNNDTFKAFLARLIPGRKKNEKEVV